MNAFQRVTVVSTTEAQFFPTTDWMPLTGLAVRAWVNLLAESGGNVEVRPAYQYAQVITDQSSSNGGRGSWTGTGTAQGQDTSTRSEI